MNSSWRFAAFSEFVKLRKEFITIRDDQKYLRVTVQLHARGIKKRDTILGAQIKTKRQQVIKAGDLLVAEIDAKVGGFGIVPPELAGAIVSNHYYIYEVDTSVINMDYLEYYLRSGKPTQELQQYVKGATNYASIRNYHFPKVKIPLPDLEEQERTALVLEVFSRRCETAECLISQLEEKAHKLLTTSIDYHYNRQSRAPLLTIEESSSYVQRGKRPKYATFGQVAIINQKCVQNEGLNLEHARYLSDEHLPKWQPWRFVRQGDILLNSTGEGTLGRSTVVPSIDKRLVVDSHVTIIRPNRNLVRSKWIDYFLKSTSGQKQIHASKRGSTKQTELNKSSILSLFMNVPSIETQNNIIVNFDYLAQKRDMLIYELQIYRKQFKYMITILLEKAFKGELKSKIPETVIAQIREQKASQNKWQTDTNLVPNMDQTSLTSPMQKIAIESSTDLTRLLQYLAGKGHTSRKVTATELWTSSQLGNTDLFYAYLKSEHEAGRIIEQRDGYKVYLELGHESEQTLG